MAQPRRKDLRKIYYHGTSLKDSAKSILKTGIKPPDLTNKKQNKLTPQKGKVYITPNLRYAIIYSIGGDFIGVEHKEVNEPFGYLFVIDGQQLKDIHPDEDVVGEMVCDVLREESNLKPYHKYKLSDEIKKQLSHLAKYNLTPLQLQKVKRYDDYGDLAVAGKKLNQVMDDDLKLALIDAGAHVAHTGELIPKECWEIRKEDAVKLNKDGKNFFEIARKIKG